MNPRANVEDIYPLTAAQEGILFHSLYEPEQGTYVEQLSCELATELDVEAFRSAWQLVVDHHPALRTAFVWDKRDKPFQVAFRRVPLALRVSEGPIDASAERARPFDLGRPPLLRLALAPTGAGGCQLVWTWHHIILDRFSVTLVLDQVMRAYHALLRGAPATLPASRPYRNYVDWLRKQDLAAAERFWRRELQGYDAPVPLPFERRVARGGASRVRTLRREFPAELASGAAPFAARCRVSLNTLIEGAWAVTLGRYTGAGRVVWGRAVLGRPAELAGADAIPGLFINTVPVVATLERAAPVGEWLRSFQQRQSEARAFEYTPLSSVQSWSGVPRGEALFDILLVFLQLHQDGAAPHEVDLGVRRAEWFEKTNYGVSAGVTVQPRLTLQVDFDATRFAEDDIASLSGTYFQVLRSMLRQPERPLGLLSALGESDDARLAAWNATAAPFPVERTFSELFEEQARRAPDAVAVECPRERLTYGELEGRAARLARALHERGIGAEDVVALLMPRGSAFLTSVLGVFRAGAAYLPLDPHHPSERLLGVLRRSGARVVITDGSLDDMLMGSGAELLHADEATRGAATSRPCPRLAEAAAYVIYTSGSTGVPKGAVVEQRGMVNHIFAKLEALGMSARDNVAQTASQCFDISVWQFLAPLLVGARVCVFPDELGQDPVALTRALLRQRVSVLELVPAQIRALLDEPSADLGPVRELLSTGEALDPELARRCRERYPDVRLLNAYGPTECSDDVAHHVVLEPDPALASVPIGRPVPNIRLYVLDRERQPVPPGAVGELYVGGVGVGRGYLGDPGRSAEAFLPDHLGPRAGARLYRTGDAARLLRDDTLDFLGRLDDQVKVRGYRIELGEIETVLKQHPDVSDAAVAVTLGPAGEHRLVACVQPSHETVTLAELRPWLQRTLPAYMIPAALVQVPALPRGSNGKLDRKAVARLAGAAEIAPAGAVPPRTPTEAALVQVWAAALRLQGPIGVDANFFEIGGDSILSIQVVSRAAREGLRFTVRDLFENPTVAELAASVDRAKGESASAPDLRLPQLTPREAQRLFGADAIEDSYPLSPMQQGMLFYDLLEPEAGAYNVEISVSIEEPLDEAALVQAWRATLAHHAVFRTSFVFEEREEPLQAVHAAVDFPVLVEDWRDRDPQAQEALIEERLESERARRWDLRRAPLTRVVLIRRADAHYHLIWTYHHILLDGWSWPLVFRDLFTAYAAASEGRPIQLPAPRPFRDHIAWLRQQDGDAAARFWREDLAGLPPRPPLDVAAPAAGAAVAGYRSEWTRLSPDAAGALRALARERRVTLNSVFQAAWALWLASRTRARDLVFGVAVAGRPAELAGVDQIVGPFINALPLRVRLDPAASAAALLSELHVQNARVRQFEYAPLARIAGWAGRPSGEPLFETFVAFQNYPVDPSALGQGRRVDVRNPQSAIRTNNPLTLGVIPGDEIALYLLYDAGRFAREAVAGVLDELGALLSALARSPEAAVGALVEQARAREERRHMSKSREGLSARLKGLSAVRPKLVQVSAEDLVRTTELGAGPTPVLLFQPRLEGVDLGAWVAGHRDEIEARLREHGALLFRDFGARDEAEFGALARSLWPRLLDYTEGSTPRSDLGNQIYTSTEYPADQSIPLHNEMSYSHTWPLKIAFCVIRPAATGGETPVADSRRVYARIDPAVRARFADKGVMYVRNFGEGLDVPWQTVFRTSERAEVERHCREHGLQWEWLAGDRLRTRQVSQAVLEHPVSKERVWFNQAHLFHVSNLAPAVLESLLAILPEEELPRNAYYGDGTPIEVAVLDEIRQIYREESTCFAWKVGDVMLLDNVRVAHGRMPFSGPRRVVVAMAEAWSHTGAA